MKKQEMVKGLKKPIEVRLPDYPADPKEERMIQSILRKFGLADNQDYEKHLDKIAIELYTRRIGVGKYTKRPWPEGYTPKTRNANAPAGKRWGHWEGGKAP